jgi:hypothetical protein
MLDSHMPEPGSASNCFVSKRVSDTPEIVNDERNDHYLGELAKDYPVSTSKKEKELVNISSKKKDEELFIKNFEAPS